MQHTLILGLFALLTAQEPDLNQVQASRLRGHLQTLCENSRLAGSPTSHAAADYCAQVFSAAGFRVERYPYRVHLPRQTSQSLVVWDAQGKRQALDLYETLLAEAPAMERVKIPPMHGLTKSGQAEGPVVFAGRGTRSEFEQLSKEIGTALHGSIALIRYGGLYRGLKVQHAAEFGCAGALLYTDPEDDGGGRGKVIPEGPWRPETSIQRGSVYNGYGDPLTPGWAATTEARRLDPTQVAGLVSIPSLPISWRNAGHFFGEAGRPDKPQKLATRAQLEVRQDPTQVYIENVIAWMDGSGGSEEWVLFGGHRDAWGVGAVDNASGIAVLLEMAQVLGAAHRTGWRPERTLALATWDAEEWGLVGSTEWVEQFAAPLQRHGVAYVNLDVAASGPNFGASCTPGLVQTLQGVAKDMHLTPPESLGIPGGGSDHVPFLEIAGMEVMGFGFYGRYGAYHSDMDTPFLMERHLDPDYAHHVRATRMAIRIANHLTQAQNRVNGLIGWAQQMQNALHKLRQEYPEISGHDELQAAMQELRHAVEQASDRAPHPHRFLRFFTNPNTKPASMLWRSEGYGSTWFPAVHDALRAGEDAAEAIKKASRKMRLAADVIKNT